MKPQLFRAATLALIATAAVSLAHAAPADELREKLRTKYPTTSFNSVEESPVQGIFEIIAGDNLFYTDKSADYLFFGSMYDMGNRRDITQERRESLRDVRRVNYATLGTEKAIVEVRGDGSRKFAVFTDPDCPYCRMLEPTLDKLDNVTIYRFLYPIASLHPDATAAANSVWCEGKDDAGRLAMLKTHMSNNAASERNPVGAFEKAVSGAAACSTPVSASVKFAEANNIKGTPTLVAEDGRVLEGNVPKERLEAWLQPQPKAGAR